jgi:hypothetical protein
MTKPDKEKSYKPDEALTYITTKDTKKFANLYKTENAQSLIRDTNTKAIKALVLNDAELQKSFETLITNILERNSEIKNNKIWDFLTNNRVGSKITWFFLGIISLSFIELLKYFLTSRY